MSGLTRQDVREICEQVILVKAPRAPVVANVREVAADLAAVLDILYDGEYQFDAEHYHAPGLVARLPGDSRVLIHSVGGLSNVLGYTGVTDKEIAPEIDEVGDTIIYHVGGNGDTIELLDGNIIAITAGQKVNVTAPLVEINGPLHVTGKITSDESIEAPSIKANGVEVTAHDHAVTTAPGTTNPLGAP